MLPMHGGVWAERKRWREEILNNIWPHIAEKISQGTLLSIMSLNREIEVPTQTRLHANEDTM